MKIVFNDTTKMCIFDGEKTTPYESDYINKYIANSASMAAAKAWKNSGYGAFVAKQTMFATTTKI